MTDFLRLKPDLSHVNGYGGALPTTIIQGSETCPARVARDHAGSARLAPEKGVARPKTAVRQAGEPRMAAFLADRAERYPGQVVAGGAG